MSEVVLNLLLVIAVVVAAALLWPLVAGLSVVGIAVFLIASAIGISLSFVKVKRKRRHK
jgi:Flp pilus assembly protein TadB